MGKISVEEQDIRINDLIKEMLALFADVKTEKKELAAKLIHRAAFMQVTLEVLEAEIKEKGPTTLLVQGSQKMTIENPAQKSYNTMINRYNSTIKTLMDLLPVAVEGEADDGFDAFVCNRDG